LKYQNAGEKRNLGKMQLKIKQDVGKMRAAMKEVKHRNIA
jgi:hypothetical protein